MAYNTTPEIKEHIDAYIAEIKKDIPVDAVYMFGSHARGSAGPSSDIDLAIVSPAFAEDRHESGKWLFRKLWNVSYKNFDLVPYSPESFKNGFSPLLDQIRKTGVRVA
jgi:uncharacterized protein